MASFQWIEALQMASQKQFSNERPYWCLLGHDFISDLLLINAPLRDRRVYVDVSVQVTPISYSTDTCQSSDNFLGPRYLHSLFEIGAGISNRTVFCKLQSIIRAIIWWHFSCTATEVGTYGQLYLTVLHPGLLRNIRYPSETKISRNLVRP